MLGLRNMLLQSLRTWTAAFNSLPIASFSEFLDISLVYFLCTRVVPLSAFIEIELLIKKII